MVFSSIVFCFAFLPAVFSVYYLVRPNGRNTVLLTASLLFYAWGEPLYVVLLLISIAANYLFGRWLETDGSRPPAYRLAVALSFNLLLLGFFKYAGFFADLAFRLLGAKGISLNIPLPIGISFFTFHAMSYLIDVHRRIVPVQKNVQDFALYISLFPQLVAGPIIRYNQIASQLHTRPTLASDLYDGVERFLAGLLKKLFIANPMGAVADAVFGTPAGGLSLGSAWIGIIAYTLQIYFDFSGYSDMAIGLGRMFGFHFPENFNYPYISRSITEFWRRWHMSLSGWFRDYLYIPLGGNRGTSLQRYRNILVVWTLTGFWHGASWTFMAWGLYYGLFLLLEVAVMEKVLKRLPGTVGRAYTLGIVMIGWVFFRADDFGYSFHYVRTLFGFGVPSLVDGQAVLLLKNNWMVMLIGTVCSFPVIPWMRQQMEARCNGRTWPYARSLLYTLIFIFNVMLLVNTTYNPFIYSRF